MATTTTTTFRISSSKVKRQKGSKTIFNIIQRIYTSKDLERYQKATIVKAATNSKNEKKKQIESHLGNLFKQAAKILRNSRMSNSEKTGVRSFSFGTPSDTNVSFKTRKAWKKLHPVYAKRKPAGTKVWKNSGDLVNKFVSATSKKPVVSAPRITQASLVKFQIAKKRGGSNASVPYSLRLSSRYDQRITDLLVNPFFGRNERSIPVSKTKVTNFEGLSKLVSNEFGGESASTSKTRANLKAMKESRMAALNKKKASVDSLTVVVKTFRTALKDERSKYSKDMKAAAEKKTSAKVINKMKRSREDAIDKVSDRLDSLERKLKSGRSSVSRLSSKVKEVATKRGNRLPARPFLMRMASMAGKELFKELRKRK